MEGCDPPPSSGFECPEGGLLSTGTDGQTCLILLATGADNHLGAGQKCSALGGELPRPSNTDLMLDIVQKCMDGDTDVSCLAT